MNRVDIQTGARLHFGLLCGDIDSGWHYGGIGMMIDRPSWRLHAALIQTRSGHEADQIECSCETTRQRAMEYLQQFRQMFDLKPVRLQFIEEPGFHAGLGTGTQLALMLYQAFRLLSGRTSDLGADVREMMGRGRRSGIGSRGFEVGGFLIDHGKPTDSNEPRMFTRLKFPEEWRLVLLTHRRLSGLSGSREESFFQSQPLLTKEQLQPVTAIIQERIVPAISTVRFDDFHRALSEYGDAVGNYYASEQGGIFSSRPVAELLRRVADQGLPGAVQSSWGPTVCIPAESQEHAEDIVRCLSAQTEEEDTAISVSGPLNTGAGIQWTSDAIQTPNLHRSLG